MERRTSLGRHLRSAVGFGRLRPLFHVARQRPPGRTVLHRAEGLVAAVRAERRAQGTVSRAAIEFARTVTVWRAVERPAGPGRERCGGLVQYEARRRGLLHCQ